MSEILIYTLVWISSFVLVYINDNNRIILHFRSSYITQDRENASKISFFTIIIISTLFTLFDVYVTEIFGLMGGDRENYYVDFMGERVFGTTGLQHVSDFIHLLNGNYHILLYFSMFVCVFITLYAYKISKTTSPCCFYLLCLTQYFLTILTALKQCYASALGILSLVLILDYDTRASNMGAIVCIIIACLFHPSGYILILLYIVLKKRKNRNSILLYLFFLAIIALFFRQVMLIGASLLNPIIPSLSSKILEYFAEGSIVNQDTTTISVFKGVPYFIMAFLGIIERKKIGDKIENYDNYLIVTVTGAFIYLMSIYSAWLSRFVYLFGFISIIFFSEILINIDTKNRLILSGLMQLLLSVITYRFMVLVFVI